MAFQTHFLNPGKEAQPVSYLYDDVNYLLGFDEEGNKSAEGIAIAYPVSISSTASAALITLDCLTEIVDSGSIKVAGQSTFSGPIYSTGQNVFTNKNTFKQTVIFDTSSDIQSSGTNIFNGNNTFTKVINATSGINVSGTSSLNGVINVPGNIALNGTYGCTGRQNIGGNTVVQSNASFDFQNTPTFSNGIRVNNSAVFNANVQANTFTCPNQADIGTGKFGAIQVSGNASITGNTTVGGNLTASRVYNAVFSDYAELFPRGEETEVGDIIALDTISDKEQYVKAAKNSKLIVGVHSGQYAHLIGGEIPPAGEDFIEYNLKHYIPIGLAGRLYVKAIGEIRKGDKITVSSIPGVGQRAIKATDQIIGYALEDANLGEPGLVKIKIL